MEYAYAWDPSGTLQSWFGVRGIPHAVLVDPSGGIVWRGHPSQLDESLIEKALETALPKPIWEVPEVHGPLSEGRVAAALKAADDLGDASDGAQIAKLLRARIASRMETIQTARSKGDYLKAQVMAEAAVKELAGLPEAVTAAEVMTALAEDEEVQRVIEAQLELRGLVEMVDQVRTMSAARDLLAKLKDMAASHEGTIVQKHAKKAIRRLEQRMG